MIKFIIIAFFSYSTFATKPDVSYRESPLHTAIHNGDLLAVKKLVGQGVAINERGRRSRNTPLHWAVNTGKMSFVSFNFKTGIPSSNTKINNSRLNTYLKIIKFLIKNGANVNAKGKYGDTPLFKAPNLEIAKLLIKHGADVNAQNSYSETPLFKAPNFEIVKLLIENGADVTIGSLLCSVSIIDTKRLLLFIEKGVDVNTKCNGNTLLYKIANEYGDLELAKLLIEKGADVNVRDAQGDTPLHKSDNTKLAKLLIENGADIKLRNNKGNTALHEAVAKNNIKTAQLLIDKGVNVNVRNNFGQTPLHKVKYRKEIAKLLIEKGADVKARDNKGQTPCDIVSSEKVKKLIKEKGGCSFTLLPNKIWYKIKDFLNKKR